MLLFFTEPIQSRCAVLRYSKLTDQQVLKRLLEVCEEEKVSYTDDGLEAIVFTAQGDMRQVGHSFWYNLRFCILMHKIQPKCSLKL